MPFLDLNLKQAWLIPSAEALPNPNGTAPGWFARRSDGRVVVALPGPPREMRPMWADHATRLLRSVGLGADVASRTYRLTGIGESQVADTPRRDAAAIVQPDRRHVRPGRGRRRQDLGGRRWDAVCRDTRRSGCGDRAGTARRPCLGDRRRRPGARRSARGLDDRGWTLAVVEIGTGGSVDALLGDAPWLRFDESVAADAPAATTHPTGPDDAAGDEVEDDLPRFATRARELGGAEVGLAVRARPRAGDTAVSIAISTPTAERRVRRVVFLGGQMGRSRAALAAASVLLETLRNSPGG